MKNIIVALAMALSLGAVVVKPVETPATQPATQPNQPAQKVHPLAEVMNRMPQKLWIAANETSAIRQERVEWMVANIAKKTFGQWKLSGQVTDVKKTKVKDVDTATVNLNCPAIQVCGKLCTLTCSVTIPNAPAATYEWEKGKEVDLSAFPIFMSHGIFPLPDMLSNGHIGIYATTVLPEDPKAPHVISPRNNSQRGHK